ncbi:unnamed protein product [Paramecium octaurelia]|uniref:TRAF-type domain-containing protein n=1 Tax=Paramecium octaurelia TaxID=43137 RepID=A0A8S1WS75_PAROT|nr:unnamed protein product [Paramecium octaurelia]
MQTESSNLLNPLELLKDSGIPKHLLYQSKIEVDHLICPICLNILWKPIACGQDKCFQSYCEVCINKWIQDQAGDVVLQESLYSQSLIVAPDSGSGSQYSSQSSSFSEMPQQIHVETTLPNCPKCKRPFKKTSIPIIHNLLDSIQLSCIYEECTTKPGYEQFQKHILQCPYRRINCSGCGLQQLQNELEQHENQCEQVSIECSKCFNKMSRKLFQLHSIDDCVQSQFTNKDNQIAQLSKKIEELNQKNQLLEQKICKMLKGDSFDTMHQFSFKTMFTQNYQFTGNQAIEAKLIRPSFNLQKQKNDFLHFYINHKIKTQAVQGIIWRMRIQTLKGNLLIGICSTLCHYSIDFIINKLGEIKRKEWNENKYKLLRKGNFTFSEGDTLTFQFMPLQQCLRITNENRHIVCRFEPTEIIEMGDSFFSFFSLENQGDSLIFI